ncbi:uncharacterized protein MONOS_2876 [Monocercomonoides exilis]|uniref:uncharacterized protein n=1 Tax=Monocercomonoides exilis TaxID=2049356 RepID=UPI00355AB185|nr:hypothetical protein MONOS_2876 [Monocercomonoides exilis]|eukprot:MONOS_2876.1-p1 / transcript=MONOS_2876.1 / gene=MONOS_2876 / organism=Monocercomonoides_exilis_PA203 / gene_product=unspecified product / transcript_product=unspecified product / location=Mono_scaffold00062:123719-125160(-) / protein_length=440 / sequence_SO=supercontig / SO=protein_coding / is_pseudo=false
MTLCIDDKHIDEIRNIPTREKFLKLLDDLENCNEDAQKQKIVEMNEIIDEMNEELFKSVFSKEMFDKIDEMIEEKKLTLENAVLLLKHIGYLKGLIKMWSNNFEDSKLIKRIEKMIAEEEKKKELKNEKLLVDICECYISLRSGFPPELLSICVPCLLKVALKKEESEETQKETEMALLALNRISAYRDVEQELYLNEIREIFKYHQEHHNLTRLSYQSVWEFLFCRLFYDGDLEDIILNELHLVREATRELEELSKCIDWKKNEDKMKEMKDESVLGRWISTLNIYFRECQIRKKEHVVLIGCIVQMLRAAKDNHREICEKCIELLITVSYNTTVEIEDLLKSGAVDAFLGEIIRFDLIKSPVDDYLQFFENVCERLKNVNKKENEETKRKETKRKVFDRLEEEGYEDCIILFICCIVEEEYRNIFFVQRIEDYFVHC